MRELSGIRENTENDVYEFDGFSADSAVDENNLMQQIATLPRALGERPCDHRYIVTAWGCGCCFVAELNSETVKAVPRSAPIRRPRAGLPSRHFDAAVTRGYGFAVTLQDAVACEVARALNVRLSSRCHGASAGVQLVRSPAVADRGRPFRDFLSV
ncbi:MAG TPA: hypothetical protein VFZ23_08160 [Pyrinomonadaceae bacterium]